MAGKRNLGMGLDILLTAGEVDKAESREAMLHSTAISYMAQAIDEDEKDNIFEAYYFYRRVIDCLEQCGVVKPAELLSLASQALNNSAVILCENGKMESAQICLERAVELYPHNQVARENLQSLISLKI
jgi:tetratricopeptide (TPR) repeat protein